MDSSYHYTDNFGADPYEEERREEKKMKKHFDMLQFVAAAEYGIPRKCPCGGSIKRDVSPTPKYSRDFDTLPGRLYFTCTEYKDDGLHFCQPWVFGVEEEIEKLQRKVEKQSKTIEEQRKMIEEIRKEIASLKM